jgi:hypothetical protein
MFGIFAIAVACAWLAGADTARDDGAQVFVLRLGQGMTFPPGVVEPGDLIKCQDEAGRNRGGAGVGPPGTGVVGIMDTVAPFAPSSVGVVTNEDGSVSAGCE